MADQLTDLATANAILKEDYLGPLRSAVNTATPMLDRLEKNSRDIVGREAWIPVEMALNQGAGARAEDQQLPDARKGEYKELKVQLKNYYGTMKVSGPILRQSSKGDRGSFARIVDVESKAMERLLKTVLAHDFYKGASLGTTKADGTGGDDVIELDDAAGADTNMEYFKKGMLVDVRDAGGALIAGGAAQEIASVDKVAKTISLRDPGTLAPSAVVEVVGGSVSRAGTWGATITSLEELVDDTADVFGVTTASFDEWKAQVNSSFGAFTTDKFQQFIDDIVVASGKHPTAIYGDYNQQRIYFGKLTAEPRYMVAGDAMKTLNGGFRSLEYSAGSAPIPWIADRLCPAGTLYLLHEPDMQVFSPGDFEFIEIGGDVWLPDILGSTPKDNFKAVLFRDMELGIFNRNSHGKLKGVTA